MLALQMTSRIARRIPSSARKIVYQAGQKLVGRKFKYLLHRMLGADEAIQSSLWLAKVFPGCIEEVPAEWAVVKTAEPEKWPFLKSEFDAYQKPHIRNSPFIRAFYDYINDYKDRDSYEDEESFNAAAAAEPFILVMEYMETPLAKVDPELNKRRPEFMKALFEAHLEGTRDIHNAGLIWTDAQPANVLCSNVDSLSPIIKLADLGSCRLPTSKAIALQPFAMRAPETWTGCGCYHVSDVWSIGANILSWLKPGILGDWGFTQAHQTGWIFTDAWCMAKVRRLFETDTNKMPATKPDVQPQLDALVSEILAHQPPRYEDDIDISLPTPTSPELLDVLNLLHDSKAMLSRFFVMDINRRPTSEQLLRSKEYQALEHAAKLSTLNVPKDDPTVPFEHSFSTL